MSSSRRASALAAAPHNLTQHEMEAMQIRHNLAAAHCRQAAPAGVVRNLPALWRQSEQESQRNVEERFLQAFFGMRRQPVALENNRTLLSYSASVSTLVVATHLMQQGKSASLIEPCVDNIADILRHMRVGLAALDESILAEPRDIYARLAETVTTDAVFLVDPNNPTGFTLLANGRSGFDQVIRFCRDFHKILILDLCFASFALADPKLGRFDIYELLEESGVSYMVIEDTGKSWPVRDAKCAMLTVSQDLWDDIYDIHTSVLLNVSPFVLKLVTEHIRQDSLSALRDIVARNRQCALEALDGTILRYRKPATNLSVAWFEIINETVDASELQRAFLGEEVYALPGTYFYWRHPERGRRFLRIALAREPAEFAVAMARLRPVVRALAGTRDWPFGRW